MKTTQFPSEALAELIRAQKIATMGQLADTLGTDVKRTVFRKLKELGYRTSYSHRGSYYTLDDVADFDDNGLWSYKSVWFSTHGTLLATVEAMVNAGEFGHFLDELDNALHVGTKDAVRKLVRDGRLGRKKVGGRYLYGSVRSVKMRQQVLARKVYAERTLGGPLPEPETMHDELKAAIILFFSLLDEKQRRLYAGLESLKMGHGGDRRMAVLLGLGVGAVARGRRELVERDVEGGRTRKEGAGRKSVEKKHRR
jgi:hypothetical protein